MSGYWPWWAGALGLALVTINYTLTTDRSFGVSSAWDRVLHWRRERGSSGWTRSSPTSERSPRPSPQRPPSTSAPTTPRPPCPGPYGTSQPVQTDVEPTVNRGTSALAPAPLVTQAALLVSIFLGGLIAAVTSGRFELRLDMGAGFRDIVTAIRPPWSVVLFVGGMLVGFGTRLAGGCSSGHGLSGCGRLRPVSLVATAVFFGTAVVVSFLLWKVI